MTTTIPMMTPAVAGYPKQITKTIIFSAKDKDDEDYLTQDTDSFKTDFPEFCTEIGLHLVSIT